MKAQGEMDTDATLAVCFIGALIAWFGGCLLLLGSGANDITRASAPAWYEEQKAPRAGGAATPKGDAMKKVQIFRERRRGVPDASPMRAHRPRGGHPANGWITMVTAWRRSISGLRSRRPKLANATMHTTWR
jgi:hypothetical protein